MKKGSDSEKIKQTVGKPKLSKTPEHHCINRKQGLCSELKNRDIEKNVEKKKSFKHTFCTF